ncbi:SDR family oxidoreductase [Agriterribacter sp.]|uniref:SDR family NAD(P)-dependent oxidoreductase n=1 Tax=Agriterribacter sp. TaxID=2821509 RepID=UPI002CA96C8D|nr:SDR family oxidoreductase [Agriterribacter sp.]HRP55328.1 SDR family oxidoreductase [Agriterribacter sp.]
MFRLDGKIAVVTGGASGIGESIVCLFQRRGALVYVLDLNPPSAEKKVPEKIIFKQCNITSLEKVRLVIGEIMAERRRLDIIVNSAGIAHIGTVETTPPEEFTRLFDVNVRGVYNLLHTCIPYMKTKGGCVLNIASTASHVGLPERFAYSMTKGAVAAITLSVAKDFLSFNIRCNSISPARIHTPFVDGFIAKNYPDNQQAIFQKLSLDQPVGRMGDPAEVAGLALFLCSDEAGFITGNDYAVDGGVIKLST